MRFSVVASVVIAVVAVIIVHTATNAGSKPAHGRLIPAVAMLNYGVTPPPVQSELLTYYHRHVKACGKLIGRTQWHKNTVKQRATRCTIKGVFSHARIAPAPVPPPPLPVATARPTATATARPVIVFTATPIPTATDVPTPVPSSVADQFLDVINQDRLAHGADPLTVSAVLTNGSGACQGAYQHAVAMAASGSIWHQNAAYPANSFNADVCAPAFAEGQNVGEFSGDGLDALMGIQQLMLNEQWSAGCGPGGQFDDHACNLRSPTFRRLGLGIYVSGGYTWLVETFTS